MVSAQKLAPAKAGQPGFGETLWQSGDAQVFELAAKSGRTASMPFASLLNGSGSSSASLNSPQVLRLTNVGMSRTVTLASGSCTGMTRNSPDSLTC